MATDVRAVRSASLLGDAQLTSTDGQSDRHRRSSGKLCGPGAVSPRSRLRPRCNLSGSIARATSNAKSTLHRAASLLVFDRGGCPRRREEMNEFRYARDRQSKKTSPPSATAFMHSASVTASSSIMAPTGTSPLAGLGLFFVLLGVG